MAPINSSQACFFPSKRDWWIVGLIWFGIVVSVVGGLLPIVLAGTSWVELGVMGSLVAGMDGLMLWVLYGTSYTITPERLVIRCGPFTFLVTLKSIHSIIPTRRPWSSPACSLDRLNIVYGVSQQSIMVSPEDKLGFLSAIVKQSSSLTLIHDRVLKKTDPSAMVVDPLNPPQVLV